MAGANRRRPSFELPYSGTSSVNDAAFEVINNGTGISSCAISAKLTSPSSHSDATAAYFSAVGSNGMALYATNDGGYSVRSYNSGSGTAYYGSSSSGNAAYFSSGGSGTYGVRGHASNGRGVYASSNGTGVNRTALFAENTNSAGIAFMATAGSSDATSVIVNQGTGDIIRGFSGTSGGDLVFRVKNDGTTAVSVLEITGGSDLAEPFDVSEPQAEPGMVVEIDPDNPGKLRIARGAYNRRVAGIISGANGVAVGMQLADLPGSENSMPIALSGRACGCTATRPKRRPGGRHADDRRTGRLCHAGQRLRPRQRLRDRQSDERTVPRQDRHGPGPGQPPVIIASERRCAMRICLITIAAVWLVGAAYGQELKLTPEGIPEGHMIIEGDIIVPLDFFEQRATYATNLWPNGTVPYVFDANMDAAMQTAALSAMGMWEDVATLSFIPRTSQSAYVRFPRFDGEQFLGWSRRYRADHQHRELGQPGRHCPRDRPHAGLLA